MHDLGFQAASSLLDPGFLLRDDLLPLVRVHAHVALTDTLVVTFFSAVEGVLDLGELG